MNVFEDLIQELKQEKLLESTVIDIGSTNEKFTDERSAVMPDDFVVAGTASDHNEHVETGDAEFDDDAPNTSTRYEAVDIETSAEIVEAEIDRPSPPVKRQNRDFFNKRAIGEMSSLQMVDHVLTGVEREYRKVIPKPFDDYKAKIALNAFLQVTENAQSEAHAQAEFALMQETEAWCSALAERDKNISVSHLRQFCENSRPALSAQAMLSIGKFYRNLPYNETVRAKFDFVITRLFSKPGEGDRREFLFLREDAVNHVRRLYGEWSSIPLYSVDESDTDVLLAALSFEELAAEAESAANFDDLVRMDFFGRLRTFKESISEMFYAPTVTVAAIEANIRIGNRYVELIAIERAKLDSESIQARYANIDASSMSDAAGRSLDLVGKLYDANHDEVPESIEEPDEPVQVDEAIGKPSISVNEPASRMPSFVTKMIEQGFAVNKWMLAVSVVIIILSLGIFLWGNFLVDETVSTAGVESVDLNNAELEEHVKVARKSSENLYIQLRPSWDAMTKEQREVLLQKYLQSAKEFGCVQVTLLKNDGKPAGYASATRTEFSMP
jgi:hypothetical protein